MRKLLTNALTFMFRLIHLSSWNRSLSDELILKVFEYFNIKEILQPFSNLTPLINVCIFDQRQQIHSYLDRQMPSFLSKYSPDQVISFQIEHLIMPLDTFPSLKSLHIIHDDERKDECLNVVKEVRYNINKFWRKPRNHIYLHHSYYHQSTSSFLPSNLFMCPMIFMVNILVIFSIK